MGVNNALTFDRSLERCGKTGANLEIQRCTHLNFTKSKALYFVANIRVLEQAICRKM